MIVVTKNPPLCVVYWIIGDGRLGSPWGCYFCWETCDLWCVIRDTWCIIYNAWHMIILICVNWWIDNFFTLIVIYKYNQRDQIWPMISWFESLLFFFLLPCVPCQSLSCLSCLLLVVYLFLLLFFLFCVVMWFPISFLGKKCLHHPLFFALCDGLFWTSVMIWPCQYLNLLQL